MDTMTDRPPLLGIEDPDAEAQHERAPLWQMSLEEKREAAFQEFLILNEPYVAAIREAGDEPWHGGDIARRRDLYMRRFTKPPPPPGLLTSLADIRADETWQPASEAEHTAA